MKCIICLEEIQYKVERCNQCFIADIDKSGDYKLGTKSLNWFQAPIPYTEIFEDEYVKSLYSDDIDAREFGYLMP